MADYHSTPFADNSDAATPWGALTAALATHGVLVKSDSSRPDGEEAEARPCRSCADLLLPPPTSSSVSDDDADTTNDDVNAANDNDNPPLLLVLISGSWCAPCRNFTPVLSASSSTLTDANCTVLFLSADADLSSFRKYYAAMPSDWRAVPYSEEEEDEGLAEDDRDDLMEALGAASLPALVVLDPLSGTVSGNGNNANTTGTKGAAMVVVPSAVREVQAAGPEGMARLIGRWKAMAAANRRNNGAGDGTGTGTGAAAARPIQSGSGDVQQHEDNGDADHDDGDEDDAPSSLILRYSLPDSTPALLCQYFRTQLLSPRLPPSLSAIILRREDLTGGDDAAALEFADGLRTNPAGYTGGEGKGETWAFRTAAPALPLDGWGGTLGGSFGLEAGAIECWQIERDGSNDDDGGSDDDDNSISRAVVTIENETGRYLLVFRETIVMERTSSASSDSSADDGTATGGCLVTKTLNLDGVPAVARGAFERRWRRESEAIFHALLGTCDRRKMMGGTGGG